MSTLLRALLFLTVAPLLQDSVQASIPDPSAGENLLGIYLDTGPTDNFLAHLEQLESLGFRLIEVEGMVSELWRNHIVNSNMIVFVRQPRTFTTAFDIQHTDSLFRAKDHELIQEYHRQLGNRFVALSPFTYPNDVTANGLSTIRRYVSQLSAPDSNTFHFYYLSANPDLENGSYQPFSFRSVRSTADIDASSPIRHFVPTGQNHVDLEHFYTLLEYTRSAEESILFIPHSWILQQLDLHDWFGDVLLSFNRDNKLIRLQPASGDTPPAVNLDVILLLLLLASLFLHMQLSPSYKDALFRYFLSHTYFLEQLVQYRIRHFFTGFIILVQHAILAGILLHIFSETILSEVGMELLTNKASFLFPAGSGPLHLIAVGALIAMLIQLVSSLWLQLFNRGYHLRQTLLLYGWPLHLNIPVLFMMTAIHHGGGSDLWIALLATLFGAVWVLSFTIAAFDLSSGVSTFRILYLVSTAGLHILLHLLLLVALVYYPPLSELIRMALTLQ